jgi:hypothetical protein
MENRSGLGGLLIVCGTFLVASALVLVGYLNALDAADVQDHRAQSSNLLRDPTIEHVTLSEWDRPTPYTAYATIVGGFALIYTGIRKASEGSLRGKSFGRDDLA